MSRCKQCGNELVTVRSSGRCVICGGRIGFFRGMGAKSVMTQRGAVKAVREATGRPVIRVGKFIVPTSTSWQAAEAEAAIWMTRNGYRDAKLTPPGADGGVDITSSRAVGQVKYLASAVGISDVQRHSGIAASVGKKALFFSRSGYTRSALAWARANQVELYLMDPIRRL